MEIHCSQLARPMVCAGFLSFENLPKSEGGPAAEEGTAYGELVERMLLNQPIPMQARNGVYFDDDMRFYARPVVDEILNDRESEVLCEQIVDWQTRSGVWIRGKYDISFLRRRSLYIDDNKYGWGIVEAPNNWQLIGYAIGEIIRRATAIETIILRIHQPRPHHEGGPTREWVISYKQLLELKEQIEVRMESIVAGERTLTTGKQCKYCAAAAEACPAFNRLFYRALEVSTEFTQDVVDEAELARQLDHVHRAQEVIKIKMDSLNELAVSRIKGGKLIPGYQTETRYGDRKWKGIATPEVIKTLTGKDVMEKSMLSPAKAEKLGIHKDFINQLVDRHFLGQRLVKADTSATGNKIFGKVAPK